MRGAFDEALNSAYRKLQSRMSHRKSTPNMELRPNRVKEKIYAGEVAVSVVGFTHPDDIDVIRPDRAMQTASTLYGLKVSTQVSTTPTSAT